MPEPVFQRGKVKLRGKAPGPQPRPGSKLPTWPSNPRHLSLESLLSALGIQRVTWTSGAGSTQEFVRHVESPPSPPDPLNQHLRFHKVLREVMLDLGEPCSGLQLPPCQPPSPQMAPALSPPPPWLPPTPSLLLAFLSLNPLGSPPTSLMPPPLFLLRPPTPRVLVSAQCPSLHSLLPGRFSPFTISTHIVLCT